MLLEQFYNIFFHSFSVTDSLLLPFEPEIYWIQHIIIIVIPIYLVTFDTGYKAHRVFQIDRFLQGLSYATISSKVLEPIDKHFQLIVKLN